MLFVASAVAAGVVTDIAAAPAGRPTEAWQLSRRISNVILHHYAMRMAAVMPWTELLFPTWVACFSLDTLAYNFRETARS